MRVQSIVTFSPDSELEGVKIPAPVTGQVGQLSAMNGAHQALSAIGQGVEIKLEGQRICAPINGKIIDFVPSFGKVIIQAGNKMRFLLQLCYQHIDLHGLGLRSYVKVGQTVEAGQVLFQLDLYKIKLQRKPVVMYMLVLDHQHLAAIHSIKRHVQLLQDPIFSIQPATKAKTNKK